MNQRHWVYLGQLTRALQIEGVDGKRAGEFVAEIDSHLADSGADPVDEFGTPFELAAELARRPGALRPGWIPPLWAAWIVGWIAAMFMVVAVDAAIQGWEDNRIPVGARGVVYVTVLYGATMAFNYVTARRLDGRSWKALTGGWAFLVILGVAAATTTLSQMAGDRVIARVPAAWFWITAAVAIPLIVFLLVKRNNPIRFPDRSPHLRRLKWGPFAGPPPAEPVRGTTP